MKSLLFMVCIALAASCGRSKQADQLTEAEMQERLLEINRDMMSRESQRIDEYVAEQGWPVIKTGTGLRYYIYNDIDSQLAAKGQTADVAFTVTLLDGTVCYATEDGQSRQFRVEHSDVESGLHEAIQYMSVGDKAKVIIPSHLAHGLAGDLNRIPVKSTIVYDISLLGLR